MTLIYVKHSRAELKFIRTACFCNAFSFSYLLPLDLLFESRIYITFHLFFRLICSSEALGSQFSYDVKSYVNQRVLVPSHVSSMWNERSREGFHALWKLFSFPSEIPFISLQCSLLWIIILVIRSFSFILPFFHDFLFSFLFHLSCNM